MLVDSWRESDGKRKIFTFKLVAIEGEPARGAERLLHEHSRRRRLIPTQVKLEMWKRDGGRCVKCGAANELHFDHIVHYSRGGTSLRAHNIQLLCARHNIAKRDNIE